MYLLKEDLLRNFISKYYEGESDVLLVGSGTESDFHLDKDIDLLIISIESIDITEDRIWYLGFQFHIFKIPFELLLKHISKEILYSQGSVLLAMLSNSISIKESKDFTFLSNSLITKDYYCMSAYFNILKTRYRMGELLIYFRKENRAAEALYIFNEMFRLLIDVRNKLNNTDYVSMPKRRAKLLSENEELFQDYIRLTKTFVDGKSWEKCMDFITDQMQCVGGILIEGSSNDIIDKRCTKDQLVLFFSVCNTSLEKINELYESELLVELKTLIEDTNHYLTFRENSDFIPRGFYFVINAESTFITSSIIPFLDSNSNLQLSLPEGISINYPFNVNFTEGIEFGGRKYYEGLKYLFAHVSSVNEQFYQSKSLSFVENIKLLTLLISSFYKSKRVIKVKLKNIVEYYIKRSLRIDSSNSKFAQLRANYIKKTKDWFIQNKEIFELNIIGDYENVNLQSKLKEVETYDVLKKAVRHILHHSSSNTETDLILINCIDEILNISFIKEQSRGMIFIIICSAHKIEL